MALNTQLGVAAQNAAANALGALANSGFLRIYDGTQPANADVAVSSQVLLAELVLNATAFGAAAAGVITANTITVDASANATGLAAWFRVLKSDGTTALFDGSVGTSGANLNMNSANIQANAEVGVTSLTYTANRN